MTIELLKECERRYGLNVDYKRELYLPIFHIDIFNEETYIQRFSYFDKKSTNMIYLDELKKDKGITFDIIISFKDINIKERLDMRERFNKRYKYYVLYFKEIKGVTNKREGDYNYCPYATWDMF